MINEYYRIYKTRVFMADHIHNLTIGFISAIPDGHRAAKSIDAFLNKQ